MLQYYERVFCELNQEIEVMENQIKKKIEENRKVDKAIINMNVTVNDLQLRRNISREEMATEAADER